MKWRIKKKKQKKLRERIAAILFLIEFRTEDRDWGVAALGSGWSDGHQSGEKCDSEHLRIIVFRIDDQMNHLVINNWNYFQSRYCCYKEDESNVTYRLHVGDIWAFAGEMSKNACEDLPSGLAAFIAENFPKQQIPMVGGGGSPHHFHWKKEKKIKI